MGVWMSVQDPAFNFGGHILRDGIDGSHGHSSFNFLRNHYTIFRMSCVILYTCQHCTGVPISVFVFPDSCGCGCSVTQLGPALCDSMDHSTSGFPVLHSLLEFAQTHIHWVDDVVVFFTVAILTCVRWFIAFPPGFFARMLLPDGEPDHYQGYIRPMPRAGLARAGASMWNVR